MYRFKISQNGEVTGINVTKTKQSDTEQIDGGHDPCECRWRDDDDGTAPIPSINWDHSPCPNPTAAPHIDESSTGWTYDEYREFSPYICCCCARM